ncbi:cyclin-C-like [Acanthaster planci]|uniref:Cyclin-C-like n=1 Tax=Acanthaster planci TaxID=133434 RepID=A0A8B7ZAS9_ACAPL|nr:cyclin-C-like [Acanthaster planci]XP_022101921.1 cyclin-C-like [Acanthaster planci]XP_022101922.1 cyclin-C-like [Acanthaster planci]XP_022101923.1 cyclin-C-like [Acanthaster planci]
MAGNFWQSSHCNQWILDPQILMRDRQKDLMSISEEEYQKVMIFYCNIMQAIGEQLKVRQQVIATGMVYFKRFYAKHPLNSIDPLLVGPTSIFLASKVEEFGVITSSRLMNACQSVVKKFAYAIPNQEFPFRMTQVLECEFFLLEIMDCCLIVFHPYRPLMQYVADLGQEDILLPLAWRIVNDSLRTDVCLLYPPYLIALACLHMACVISQKDTKHWFAELNVDLDKVLEITQQILKLYELWKSYDEKKDIPAILAKVPKAQLQPPPSQSESQSGAGET